MATLHRQSSSSSDTSSSSSQAEASGTSMNIVEGVPDQNQSAAGNDGMDRFLQKMRSDLMYELRNLQHGERPVTGQDHRENIKQFMKKHVVGHTHSSAPSAGGKEIYVANVDNVEQHRPEAVVVEVQGIIEQRRVSNVLQSAAFRRQLENVIRGSISNVRRDAGRDTSSPGRQNWSHPSTSATNSGAAISSARSSPIPAPRRTLEARPQLVRSESTDSIESFSSARSSLDQEQDIDSDVEEEEIQIVPPVVTPRSAAPRLEQTPPPQLSARERSPRDREPTPQQEASPEIISWGDISRIHRDELVEEISELLHHRLVSSTLEGEFRATLELHVQDRLSASGTNGQAVQDYIHSLPPSGVPHNDFSHLGIAQVADDNLDNISVTGVSTHSVPYVQTNTYLGREIQSLRSQMNEMKNMLKLTFDLQMDIQRAIRQEVAAAMSNVVAQGATAGITASIPQPTRPISDTHCLICLERHTDTVLYQCGHMCVCYACGRDLVSRGHNCPVCRAPIKDVIRAYKTNAE